MTRSTTILTATIAIFLVLPSILAQDARPTTKRVILKNLAEQMRYNSTPTVTNAAELVRFYTASGNWHSNQAALLAIKMTSASSPGLKDHLHREYAEEAVCWKDSEDILKLAQDWASKPTASNYFAPYIRSAQIKLVRDVAGAKKNTDADIIQRQRKPQADQEEQGRQRKWEEERAEQTREIQMEHVLNHMFDWCFRVLFFPIPFLVPCSGAWVSLLLNKKHRWMQLAWNGALALGLAACFAYYLVMEGVSFNAPHHTLAGAITLTLSLAVLLALHLWAYLDPSRGPVAPWRKLASILLSCSCVAWMVWGLVKLVMVPGLSQ